MREPRIEATIRLADGRRLAFAEYGDPEGEPAMLFHGLPGSRLVAGGPTRRTRELISPRRSRIFDSAVSSVEGVAGKH